MFGEFNEATQLKTSLAKYSIELNDLAVQMRPHRIAYLRLLGRPYTLLYMRRSVGRLTSPRFRKSDLRKVFSNIYLQILQTFFTNCQHICYWYPKQLVNS